MKEQIKGTQNQKMNGSHQPINEDTLKELSHSVSEMSEKVKDISGNMAKQSLDFAKKYPLHTAIGAAVFGYFVGTISKSVK